MWIIEAIADTTVFDRAGQPVYDLRQGISYLLYDDEAQRAERHGAARLIEPVDRRLPRYAGGSFAGTRLLLPFIGRLGDAMILSACVDTLVESSQGTNVDIACLPGVRGALEIAYHAGQCLRYPMRTDQLAAYDGYLDFEFVETVRGGKRRSLADVFSACLNTPRPARPAQVVIPPEVLARWNLGAPGPPRVAIHRGLDGSLRSYPRELTHRLVAELLADGMEVYLIGTAQAPGDWGGPVGSEVRDLSGKTTTAADLAAVLARMDALVTCDSFPMHLAGALDLNTAALFAPTDAVLAADYPTTTGIQSGASCSPCGVADGSCPLGYNRCAAHQDEALNPEHLIGLVRSLVGASATCR